MTPIHHRPTLGIADAREEWRAMWPLPLVAMLGVAGRAVILGGGLFSSVSLGTTLHMVPLLQSHGFDLATAARVTGLAGLATLAGRLGTGFLLDRLPAKTIAIVTFLVPILPAGLLVGERGSLVISVTAAMIFGFTAGAESDVVAYIASRLLPPGLFASGYAIIIAIYAVHASTGPLIAARLYDMNGSYDTYLLLIVPLVIVGAGLMAMIAPLAPPERSRAKNGGQT